jgi:hypothetical protein
MSLEKTPVTIITGRTRAGGGWRLWSMNSAMSASMAR